MGNDVAQVVAPAPNIAGGVWVAPLGTTIPTDVNTTLDTAFVSLGYISDDGVTKTEDRPNTKTYAWGGSLVASLQEHYALTFAFTLLQPLDPDVQKAVHDGVGSNVTVTPPTSEVGTLTTTLLNAQINNNGIWVIEGFYGISAMRIVIPIARVTHLGAIKITHKSLLDYPVTLESFPDTNGNFAYQLWNDGIVSV